ncbi:MAG: carboxypeptidase regulatory-like domain-containing protein [Acidobacteria bacterium]|nr:carboxypeptidase regulatory-like domain-containing protein [Acidobacteriota bacterium]
MKRNMLRLLISVTIMLAAGLVAFAQTSSISGVVSDPQGAVVAGATITIKSNSTGAEFKVTTGSTGFYNVPAHLVLVCTL